MITKSGAKLLDFGLAKSHESRTVDASELHTEQIPLTHEGMIVGTFQYMAPEQVEGAEADARSDIFAFGAVLYEMLSGRRAFDGKTRASVIASILEREPPPLSARVRINTNRRPLSITPDGSRMIAPRSPAKIPARRRW